MTSITVVGHGGARRTTSAASFLDATARDQVKAEANAWIKRLRHVDYDGRTMRQRFTYRGDSLWWFTEIYLHKTRVFERAIETLLALEVAAADHPTTLAVETPDPVVRSAALAFSAARRLAVEIDGVSRRADRRERWLSLAIAPTAVLARLRRRVQPPRSQPVGVAFFLHSAFWRDEAARVSGGRESYVGPVLDAIARDIPASDLVAIGLGPGRSFRSRRWWDPMLGTRRGRGITPIEDLAPQRALREALDLWRQRKHLAQAIVSGSAVREAGRWRDYDLWSVLEGALARCADVQWPWSARSMDEARSALAQLKPEVAVTYAEAGGWGRALILEARRAGIPTVALQHGFIYRHWLNYQHAPDEMAADGDDGGFPRPDSTLVFDGFSAETLVTMGSFPPDAVAVTGSPRLDELAAQARGAAAGAADTRSSFGAAATDAVIVLASKFTEIAGMLPAIAEAVTALPGTRCVIKPHPADAPGAYESVLTAGDRISLAPAGMDLGVLLPAADALMTKNSTTAVDAMALGVPAVIVDLPNNLTPFVEAGVMAGAADRTPAGIRAALESVLYDRTVRQQLSDRASRFVELHGMRADGRAADRAAAAVLGHRARPGAREERQTPS